VLPAFTRPRGCPRAKTLAPARTRWISTGIGFARTCSLITYQYAQGGGAACAPASAAGEPPIAERRLSVGSRGSGEVAAAAAHGGGRQWTKGVALRAPTSAVGEPPTAERRLTIDS
jgi:predicted lipoprotein with Yx(FWY)xxD motif